MAKWYFIGGAVAYVAVAILVGILLANNGMERPIIGGLLWPLRIIKLLLGGG